MNTKLQRIADIAKENPKEKFSALIHHVNKGKRKIAPHLASKVGAMLLLYIKTFGLLIM